MYFVNIHATNELPKLPQHSSFQAYLDSHSLRAVRRLSAFSKIQSSAQQEKYFRKMVKKRKGNPRLFYEKVTKQITSRSRDHSSKQKPHKDAEGFMRYKDRSMSNTFMLEKELCDIKQARGFLRQIQTPKAAETESINLILRHKSYDRDEKYKKEFVVKKGPRKQYPNSSSKIHRTEPNQADSTETKFNLKLPEISAW